MTRCDHDWVLVDMNQTYDTWVCRKCDQTKMTRH